MRASSAMMMLASLAVLVQQPCAACTVTVNTIDVGRDFRVLVEDRGQPVRQLQVALSSRGTVDYTSMTDANGIASFGNVAARVYQLSVSHDSGLQTTEVRVHRDQFEDSIVRLSWPGAALAVAQSLTGVLRIATEESQQSISLQVVDGLSGRVLRSGTTAPGGVFEFQGLPDGRYFLRLTTSELTNWPRTKATGSIPVVIQSSSQTDHLDLDIGWSSCGLYYANQSSCKQSEFELKKLAGSIVDASGAVIVNTEISLFDLNGKLISRTQSDRAGEFALMGPETGTYRLLVQSAGFTPLRRTVKIGPNSKGSAVQVQLGVFGACSDAIVQ
jgi:hypothetical protein